MHNIILQDRDTVILQQITKYRFLLARQIKILGNFSSQRTCDRRLKKLIENGFIIRKYFLYGLPGLYFTTEKAKKMFDLKFITKNVRIEQLKHDTLITDTAIYLMNANNVKDTDITTERQIKSGFGFGSPRHVPDLIVQNTCYEIELNEKSFNRLEKNVYDNFKNYDKQIWIVPDDKIKIIENLNTLMTKFDLEILFLNVVIDYVKKL